MLLPRIHRESSVLRLCRSWWTHIRRHARLDCSREKEMAHLSQPMTIDDFQVSTITMGNTHAVFVW